MVAALYAKERHLDSTIEATRKFARGCAWRKFLWDWTLPILSVTTGSHLSRLVTEAVGEDTDASDLRLPFFCNVTDLMRNSSAKTLHAVAKPLWPMVRASMSVHGLVPPISLDGDLLVDGCFSSNLPVFPALSLGAHLIFAFDIGVQGEPLPADYKGMKISGWRLFGRLLRSWLWGSASTSSDGKDVLTYGIANELLTNSTNSADIQAIRALPNCLYYRQPVTHISSLDMSRFEELRKVGYDNAKTMLHKWKQEGRLDSVIMSRGDDETKTTKKATKT
jgi:lysophospholipid hydrolase